MASPSAPSTDRFEETDGDITYIRTDKDLPPVAIIDRSPITTRHKIIFGIIAIDRRGRLGGHRVLPRTRRSTPCGSSSPRSAPTSSAFRFYARLIEMKIVRPRDDNATPAELFENATDYVPTDRRVLFGHHFAAIAGAGPLVGPVLAMQMGYLPGTIWIIVGAVVRRMCPGLPGAVDLDPTARAVAGPDGARRTRGRSAAPPRSSACSLIMVILLAVLALVVVQALAQSPWGVFSIAMTIPIAMFMGFYLRFCGPAGCPKCR